MNTKKTLLGSALVLYFIIAFEVLIMIGPFAGFFYAVFNPVLLGFAAHPATRWLSAFYLPHLVLPKDGLLQVVRVMGSILFVFGAAVFFVCAGQIYYAKFARRGAVQGGLYRFIRHPQYLALGMMGLGLAILWPRFLTVVLWLFMALIYFLLAKDEERRMVNAYGDEYRSYRKKTGMFLPRSIENKVAPKTTAGRVAFGIVLAIAALGSAFSLRSYTISRLTLWTGVPNVAAVAILPEDGFKMEHRMGDILALKEVRERLHAGKMYLVYFIPRDYVMQGMIADTGGPWKLFEQHHSLAMITDWIFHPFKHLREGHHAMHESMHTGHDEGAGMEGGIVRRLIFLSIENVEVKNPADLFSINALRVPQFMVDVEVHRMKLIETRDLPRGSGWGTVPTPVF